MAEKKDVEINFTFFKKNWNWIVLFLILVLAFYLRSYHLSYPVISYHNWKEVHYLTEARNFAEEGFFAHGFFIPSHDYPHLDQDVSGAHTDTFPTISVVVGFFFMIFGSKLVVARLVDIAFVLGTIFFVYLFMKKLFKREDFALLTALITAINPLLIFFGRQTMLDNPAIFFMAVSIYFYLLWVEHFKTRDMVLFSLFLSLSILTKYSFALIALPMLALFPFKKVFDIKHLKEKWLQYFLGILMLMLTPLWMLYTKLLSVKMNMAMADIQMNFGVIFQSDFWQVLKAYAADNYGAFVRSNGSFFQIGLLFALIGFVFVVIFYKKNARGNRFILFYFLATIMWFFVMSYKLSGHNYHQYPIVLLIIILIAYCFIVIANNIEKLVKIKYSSIFIMIGLVVIIWIPSMQAKNRMFDTQFPGLDIAGEYINQNAGLDDRIFFPSGQSYGVLWHADRKGDKTPYDLATFMKEENMNVSWVFMYQWGISEMIQTPDVWDYVQKHYSLKQFAFYNTQQGAQPVYFLLEKGGSFNLTDINEILQNKPVQQKDYEYSKMKYSLYYINV
jgi:4-amino-4-deoxy-L-arabinose transferase-like glycosyltransferase